MSKSNSCNCTSSYLNGRTNHLHQTIKHACLFCFKRFPVKKASVDGKSCNRLALTESHILHHTVNECTNVFLQRGPPRYQLIKSSLPKFSEIWHKRFAREVRTRCRSIGGFLNLLLGVSTFSAGIEPGESCKSQSSHKHGAWIGIWQLPDISVEKSTHFLVSTQPDLVQRCWIMIPFINWPRGLHPKWPIKYEIKLEIGS